MKYRILTASLLACAACHAGEPALSAAEQQAILQTLMQPPAAGSLPAVTPEELNNSAMEKLASGGIRGAELIRGQVTESKQWATVSAELPGNILYYRPGTCAAADAPSWKAILELHEKKSPRGLILDLRAPAPDRPAREAAELAGVLLPAGREVLSGKETLKTSGGAAWQGRMIVLVDRNTGNTGELLAGILRTHGGALIAGSNTRGRSADFAEQVIREAPEKLTLRYPTQRWLVAGGSDFYGQGLTPDLAIPGAEKPAEALEKIVAEKGGSAALQEPEWPRINEAALISLTNPELAWRTQQEVEPPPLDRVLRAAVDTLRAHSLLDRTNAEKRDAGGK